MKTGEKEKSNQPHADESQTKPRKHSGWVTFPFLAGSMLGLGLVVGTILNNIQVYLIREYNIKSIDAAQIYTIIAGSLSLAPVTGAIISDAYFGSYPVVAVSTAISFLSLVLFTITAGIRSLRPLQCDSPGTGSCQLPSTSQLAILYTAVTLLAVGTGGTRFTLATMGADQFDRVQDRDVYFNWYFIFMYASSIVSATLIVYIQDSVSWALGFGLCTAANAMSLVALLLGTKYYRRPKAQGSPFTGLAQVAVATVWKWRVKLETEGRLNYYEGNNQSAAPSKSFRFLNRAALITQGDTNPDGSLTKPWRLCSVRQVEDFKTLIRIAPLWSSSIFLSTSIGAQISLTVLQALTMDRSLSRHFYIPAGSMIVSSLAAVVVSLALIDRLILPLWHALTHHTPTPLQRIGIGHVINAVSMAISAIVERRREAVVRRNHEWTQPGWIVPMSAVWLVVPMAIAGVGEALHFPGQVALYYQEFPKNLRSTATGMVAMILALGFYLSTALIGLVRRVTTWIPDSNNINGSRLENVYWLLAVAAAINFGYYLLCATLYKYQSVDQADDENTTN